MAGSGSQLVVDGFILPQKRRILPSVPVTREGEPRLLSPWEPPGFGICLEDKQRKESLAGFLDGPLWNEEPQAGLQVPLFAWPHPTARASVTPVSPKAILMATA